MKDIFGVIAKILGLVLAVAVIGYTSYLTFLLAQRIVPDNTVLQFMTIVLFDLACFIWFLQFIATSKSAAQWAIAALGFTMGLGGAVVMAGGELILGQKLVVIDNLEQIGWILVSVNIAAALVHALLSYMFHLTEPSVINKIENAVKISGVQQKAYQSARAEIDRQADDMGKDLAASLVYQARAELAAAALPHLRKGAQIETQAAEAMTSGLIIPQTPRQDATPSGGLSLPRWPKRPQKTTPDNAALMAELNTLRAQAARPAPATYTPMAPAELLTYAADTQAPPAVRPLDPRQGGV